MADEGFKRKLAANLSADVKGYCQLMDDDEEANVSMLTSYRITINKPMLRNALNLYVKQV